MHKMKGLKIMINRIKTIINNWDPVNLFPHAPDDEYSSEINKICSFIEDNKDHALDKLGQEILKIFIDSFGKDIFLKTSEQCKEIACKINQSLKVE